MSKLRLHQNLKDLIAERGVSAREVARACGIPQSTLTSILSGRGRHNPHQLLALCRYFGVSMEALLFEESERPPTLEEVFTVPVFEGWLKVNVEKAIPGKKKSRKGE